MFSFLFGLKDYECRKIDRYEDENMIIDTCSCPDGDQPFETAIVHPEYDNGRPIIVEAYESKKEAQAGHNRWVQMMTSQDLPTLLKYHSNSFISKQDEASGAQMEFPHASSKRQKDDDKI